MKCIHSIHKVAKKCCHSSPLMLVHLMLVLDDLREVRTMRSSNFYNYKGIREGLPANNHENGIYGKYKEKNQAKYLFEEYKKTLRYNSRRWKETNLLQIAIDGAGPTSTIFVPCICNEDTIDIGEGMKYHEDLHECTIDLLMFCEFLNALPDVMKNDVYNYHVIDNHPENIEEKIVEGMDIWNDPGQDVSSFCQNLKLYTVIIKHYNQSTEVRVQDISLFYDGGRNKGESLAILTICSMHLSPMHTILATEYKAKNKLSGNQHQGTGIDGEIVVTSSR